MIRRLILLTVLLAFAGACARQQPIIRVAVQTGMDTVGLNLEGEFSLEDLNTGKQILQGSDKNFSALTVCGRRLCIDNQPLETDSIRIRAPEGLGLRSGKELSWYRGDLDVSAEEAGTLSAINRLALEDYLRGVVPREVSAAWPMAALKAQAVASRTYALYKIARSGDKAYDVCSDVLSQVYGGRNAEHWRTNRAVKRTRGTVLMYRDEIVPAFFHASCGGHTENASAVWNLDSEVLQGTECPYCAGRPRFSWKHNFHARAVQEQLTNRGYSIGQIDTIEVTRRTASGRASLLSIHDMDNATLTMPATEFRAILGPNIVRSTRFEVIMQGYYFDLIGHGWGHGVGMCQQGACGMALSGKKMREILNFYYSGATLEKHY